MLARSITIQPLLHIKDWKLYQQDGTPNENVYVEQPKVYIK